MKLKVIFREFTLPYINPDTKEEERGEFMGSFSEEIEGVSASDILTIADEKAKEYSARDKSVVRVWDTIVVVTPSGINSL